MLMSRRCNADTSVYKIIMFDIKLKLKLTCTLPAVTFEKITLSILNVKYV